MAQLYVVWWHHRLRFKNPFISSRNVGTEKRPARRWQTGTRQRHGNENGMWIRAAGVGSTPQLASEQKQEYSIAGRPGDERVEQGLHKAGRAAGRSRLSSLGKQASEQTPKRVGGVRWCGVAWYGVAQGWETPASDRASYAASIYVKRVTMATTMLLQTERIMYVMVVHHVSRGSTGSVSKRTKHNRHIRTTATHAPTRDAAQPPNT